MRHNPRPIKIHLCPLARCPEDPCSRRELWQFLKLLENILWILSKSIPAIGQVSTQVSEIEVQQYILSLDSLKRKLSQMNTFILTKKNHGSPVGSSIHPTLSHLGLQLPNTRLLQVTVDEIEGEVFLIQPVASPVPSRIYMTKMGRLGSPSHVTTHFNVTTAQFETLIGKSWISHNLPYMYICTYIYTYIYIHNMGERTNA